LSSISLIIVVITSSILQRKYHITMYFSLVVFSIFAVLSILSAPSHDDKIYKELIKVSQQLDRFESQVNDSFHHLLDHIDEKNRNTMDLIKSFDAPEKDGEYSFFHMSKNGFIYLLIFIDHSETPDRPVSALLIIDVQNDFINGSLALKDCPSKHNGGEVVPVINQLLESVKFDVVVYSYDWHPVDHISFFDNLHLRSNLLTKDSVPVADLHLYSVATFAINGIPRMEQTLWPRHCVQDTLGAQLDSDLRVLDKNNSQDISVINIYKGTKSDIDSYSAFWDNFKLSETTLNQQLKEKNVTQVFVVGLATDWCVQSTATHAMEYGYKTFIIEDACRGVDEEAIKEKLKNFKNKNGHVIQSNEVKNYIPK
jgi:nicotinamidase-related amidase